MVKVRNFNEGLENNLARLGKDLAHERMHSSDEKIDERSIVKNSIKSLAPVQSKSIEETTPKLNEIQPSPSFLPVYVGDKINKEVKKEIERLITEALHGDIVKAVVQARKLQPFVEDAFHDALVDKLLPELKKRGFLK